MKNVGKSIVALLFFSLFIMHLAVAVSFVACDPLTDSCCCEHENPHSPLCAKGAPEQDSCCGSSAGETSTPLSDNCFCGADIAIPEYVKPLSVTLPPVTYLAETKHVVDMVSALATLCSEPYVHNINRDRPVHITADFILLSWPTIRLLC